MMSKLYLWEKYFSKDDLPYQQNISRGEIVGAAHLSASKGSRLFRKLLDQTPAGYLNRFRIEKAVKMLQQGEFDIPKIASSCGFRDSSYFATVFRKHTGSRAGQRPHIFPRPAIMVDAD